VDMYFLRKVGQEGKTKAVEDHKILLLKVSALHFYQHNHKSSNVFNLSFTEQHIWDR
jgi:hypothetical protein